jgi:hypothetical protein
MNFDLIFSIEPPRKTNENVNKAERFAENVEAARAELLCTEIAESNSFAEDFDENEFKYSHKREMKDALERSTVDEAMKKTQSD